LQSSGDWQRCDTRSQHRDRYLFERRVLRAPNDVAGSASSVGCFMSCAPSAARRASDCGIERRHKGMFGPRLDSLTLLFAISALGFVMAAIARSAARTMPAYRPALSAWFWSMLCAGIGFFLFHMREHLPWFLTFAAGNTMVILTAAFGLEAHCRLLAVRVPRWIVVVPVAFGVTVVAVSTRPIQGTCLQCRQYRWRWRVLLA